MTDCKHHPSKPVRRIEDAVMGYHYIRRDWDTMDKIYEDIICKHCGKRICCPGLIRGKHEGWILYED